MNNSGWRVTPKGLLIAVVCGVCALAAAQRVYGPMQIERLGLGVVPHASVPLRARDTTEQARIEYDVSNYMSATVSSAGAVSLDITGDSGADTTLTITNSDGTYEANVEMEGDLTVGGVLIASGSGGGVELGPTLESIEALTPVANEFIYFTAEDTAVRADVTATGLDILNDANAAAVLTTIGAQAADADLDDLADGELTASKIGTGLTDAQVSNTLTASVLVGPGSVSDAVDLATAEVAGVLPVANGGTASTTAGDARTALGLGTIATQAANAVAITGGTINGTTFGLTTPAAGAVTSLTISGNGVLLNAAQPGGYIADNVRPVIYNSGTGGSGIFNEAGHLVIQPRSSTGVNRSIVLATGNPTPSSRLEINSSGAYLVGTDGAGASGEVLISAGSTASPEWKALTAALTDATTIAVNAALVNPVSGSFTVTLTDNRTMGAPSNAIAGQKILFRIRQDATGSRTMAWNAIYSFGADGTPTLTTTAAKTDYVGFIYNSANTKWECLGVKKGF